MQARLLPVPVVSGEAAMVAEDEGVASEKAAVPVASEDATTGEEKLVGVAGEAAGAAAPGNVTVEDHDDDHPFDGAEDEVDEDSAGDEIVVG